MNSSKENQLPSPDKKVYFPESGTSEMLANEALKRAGENLVYAIEYGSHVTGDASSTSKHDMLLIVEDTMAFHKRNLQLASDDYGRPRSARFHNFLNQFGFNFYQTSFQTDDGKMMSVKYGVISRENFIKGCNGSLEEKEKDGRGAFGLYVAGRMQKAALRPLVEDGDGIVTDIEEAINTARIDGVWLAMGLLEKEFPLEDLIATYVSLSYRADVRVEKPHKVQLLVEKGMEEYKAMLGPIIGSFVQQGLMQRTENGRLKKMNSLSQNEVEKRLRKIRIKTAMVNYIKNPLTVGVGKGIEYALEKIKRARK